MITTIHGKHIVAVNLGDLAELESQVNTILHQLWYFVPVKVLQVVIIFTLEHERSFYVKLKSNEKGKPYSKEYYHFFVPLGFAKSKWVELFITRLENYLLVGQGFARSLLVNDSKDKTSLHLRRKRARSSK